MARAPEETKRLGNPGKRPVPATTEHAVGALALTPPAGLRDDGRAMWEHVAGLPWVRASDGALLLRLCRLVDMMTALDEDIETNGVTYESRGRIYANPSLANRDAIEKRIGALMADFGLSPGDRMRLGIAEAKAQSKFEQLQAEREARRGA